MADKYWFLDETPPETPELGGYSYGSIDADNPAPEGAEVLQSKTQLNRLIDTAEDAFKVSNDRAEQDNSNNGRTDEVRS